MKTTHDNHLPVDINRGELGEILNCFIKVWKGDATYEEGANMILWIRQRLAGTNLEEGRMLKSLAAELMAIEKEDRLSPVTGTRKYGWGEKG